ncbi:S-methyl-5'-thioadenosine phosphorylase [Marinimicrobium alkaliphilum]|uniref:S-methyl-5'-thioadenosine phosphorylase n=1 Tax=Marinimicrobium alkaliphilum TaxID=2202654 RepID=UPI000DB9B715|nr:S-methyl-5'-thioadenosine phosphorylase [Marinimicrobium alkaliphilum]
MTQARIGILGGSGLYQMDALTNPKEHRVTTPYGTPSDAIVTGDIHGVPVAFLARHGRGHRLLPGEVPYAANIFALKSLGVRYLLSFSAVGSLKEEIAPLDMLLPDQYIDMTRQRRNTFFGGGAVAHVSMAEPVCSALHGLLADAVLATDSTLKLHRKGTYVCMEGPQFSTLAESHWYRSMNADVIGMTNMPEAKLAREAQMAYASLAMVTDFDCWHPKEAHVNANMALQNLMQNAERAQRIALSAIGLIANAQPDSMAHTALQQSLVTPLDAMSDALKETVEVLLR